MKTRRARGLKLACLIVGIGAGVFAAAPTANAQSFSPEACRPMANVFTEVPADATCRSWTSGGQYPVQIIDMQTRDYFVRVWRRTSSGMVLGLDMEAFAKSICYATYGTFIAMLTIGEA
jgi:hypothetical protein